MPSPTAPVSKYRRRVLVSALVPVLLLFIVGAAVFINRIEADLERRVVAELGDDGFDVADATIEFSGQNGQMSCDAALDDPPAVEDAAYDVWGVHSFEIDRSCRVNDPGTAPTVDITDPTTSTTAVSSTTTAPPTTAPAEFDSVRAVLGAEPQYSTAARLIEDAGLSDTLADPDAGPFTMFVPTNDAFEQLELAQLATLEANPELVATVMAHHIAVDSNDDLAAVAPTELLTRNEDTLQLEDATTVDDATITAGPSVAVNGVVYSVESVLLPNGVDLAPAAEPASATAIFADSGIELNGAVASADERSVLADAAVAAVGDDSVTSNLIVDPAVGVGAEPAADLAELITVMTDSLVSGEATFDGEALSISGRYDDDAAVQTVESVAGELGATVDLSPSETPPDPAAIEERLNSVVDNNPILFETGSATIADESLVVLDQLAAQIGETSGVTIEVQGHTDSDGDADDNQQLSEQRAQVVRDALIARGVADGRITAAGFGEDQPIIVDGVEDKAASRRVVFDVSATN